MSVLVTGAAGAIGSYVHRRLTSSGTPTVGIDIRPEPGVEECDCGDLRRLGEVIDRLKPTLVFHCAGQMDVAGTKDPLELVRANIVTFSNLCSLLRSSTANIVYISSRGVYPWLKAEAVPIAFCEDSPVSVSVERSVYDLSKLTIEGIAQRYRLQYGMRVTGIRLSSTYGLGKTEATHGHQSLLNRLFETAWRGEPSRIRGADQQSDFVYYGDVYQALLLIGGRDETTPSPIYNISCGAAPFGNYVRALSETFPEAYLEAEGGIDYLGSGGYGYVNMSYALATRDLGYRPMYTAASAFAEMRALLAGEARPWTVSFPIPARVRLGASRL